MQAISARVTPGRSAVPLQRVQRIEQPAKRIVDLVRHAGREPAEADQPLLLGKPAGRFLAFASARTSAL